MSETPPGADEDTSGADDDGPLTRLDPDAASGATSRGAPSAPSHQPGSDPDSAGRSVIDTRRYGWIVGAIGLTLVLAVSAYQFATHGVGSTGVAPGHRLHWFAAPLATTSLTGDPNLNPPCTVARHDPRALNVCLLAARGPLVLSFFVTGSGECERQVDALQSLSRRYPSVQFAAVAIHAGRSTVAHLIRARGWTIPVAYDRDGSVGGLYGVAVCPMAELARRGGIVTDRLIGSAWQTVAELEPRVRALAATSGPTGP